MTPLPETRDGYDSVFARRFFRRSPSHNQFGTDDAATAAVASAAAAATTRRGTTPPRTRVSRRASVGRPRANRSYRARPVRVQSAVARAPPSRRHSRNRRRYTRCRSPTVRVFPPSSIRAYFHPGCRTKSPGRFRGRKKNASPSP